MRAVHMLMDIRIADIIRTLIVGILTSGSMAVIGDGAIRITGIAAGATADMAMAMADTGTATGAATDIAALTEEAMLIGAADTQAAE